MYDILGNKLEIGDRVAFPYTKYHLGIGTIIKFCKEKVRIKHDTLYVSQNREEILRYPYYVMKI